MGELKRTDWRGYTDMSVLCCVNHTSIKKINIKSHDISDRGNYYETIQRADLIKDDHVREKN